LGYAAYDWGRGFNSGPQGDLEDWLDELCDGVLEVSHIHDDRNVSLIGWSLGGIYAREIARKIPDAVRQVITLGTPFAAQGDVTNVGWLYRLLNGRPSRLQEQLAQRLQSTLPVPVTSVYSRSDGIVAWQACQEVEGPCAQNVEVEASHIGLACHPRVWAIIADRLAQPEDEWRRYEERHIATTNAPFNLVAQFVATASAHIGASWSG
jgi:pimeloyl-ACP methyl ester carboxylesterase